MDELGWRFWLAVLAVGIGVSIGAYLVFVFFGWAWYSFGFIGMFAVLAAILIGIGYVFDKREQRRRKRLAA
jgi:bacteriorhodopsin